MRSEATNTRTFRTKKKTNEVYSKENDGKLEKSK